MERVIVTVKRKGEEHAHDLELPADFEAQQLVEIIASALNWDTDAAGQTMEYQIEANPPGRMLKPDESLACAGAWDGAWLVLHPTGVNFVPANKDDERSDQDITSSSGAGPVAGWRSLGMNIQSPPDRPPSNPPVQGDGAGYVWKQVDE